MLKLSCTTMSCAHRKRCKVVAIQGNMTPNLRPVILSKYTFTCQTERITRSKPMSKSKRDLKPQPKGV